MAGLVLLPTPMASGSLTLGQLLVDPLDPESTSFSSKTAPAHKKSQVQPQYDDVVTHDDEGHFIDHYSEQSTSLSDHMIMVHADEAEYTSVHNPSLAFDALRQDPSARRFLRKMGQRDQPLYYVVGIQKLKNPTFKRAILKEGSITEASNATNPKIRLAMHVRRDSSMDMDETTSEAVYGIEVRKVKCHVGSPDEPHSLADIDYSWSYHSPKANHDDQLSIGFGKALNAVELRELAGLPSDEELTDDSSYDYQDSESDGFGGF